MLNTIAKDNTENAEAAFIDIYRKLRPGEPPTRDAAQGLLNNLFNVFQQIAVLAIIALGATMVIVSGGIDLSVGSVAALSGMVAGVGFGHLDLPMPLAVVLALLAGRRAGPALVVGGLALQQLWLFWLAPIVGGVLGGLAYKTLGADASVKPPIEGEAI